MKNLIFIFLGFLSINSIAQISHGGKPYIFSKTIENSIPVYTTTTIDVQALEAEDAVTDKYKDIAWRFGKELPVNLNLNNSGIWDTLVNGNRVWSLIINSPNATSINLNYDNFYLPKGATFFVYNKHKTLGAFNKSNNKANGQFATTLLEGESVTLQYQEPANQLGNGIIQVSSIVHGYRDLFGHLKAFGSSGNCNVNAICDNNFWGNEIRSSVMLLTSGNSRFCSGALINNTLNNGTPYVLTANHCGPQANNIFMFNYQSANCTATIDGPTTQTVVGCTTIANNAPSDFFLVKLSSIPPSNYNVFYSGWSNVNTPPTKGTGIHHPLGDVTKISHDFDMLSEDGYYTAGTDHWKVNDWNTGTTQGGSSGSPLYNQNHQVVGQLHGGDAACGNDAFDYYGKFAISWATDADTLKQLKHWLDPNNSGTTSMDGFDPNGAKLTTDAILLDVEGIPSYVCGDSAIPIITVRNNGSLNLTSLTINYQLDGGTVNQFNWAGNLTSYAFTQITLPTINFIAGNHTYNVFSTNPNGTSDQNPLNDSATINFIGNDQPLMATLNLTTDNFGAESSWVIINSAGQTIIESSGYSSILGGQNFIENLCLYDGCFSFIFKDSFGDGFCCGANGNGSFLLTEDATGDTLAISNSTVNTFIAFTDSTFICMGNATGIAKTSITYFNVYPNPSSGVFTITGSKKIESVTVFDLLGKIVFQKNQLSSSKTSIDLVNYPKGMYIAKIKSKNNQQQLLKLIVEN